MFQGGVQGDGRADRTVVMIIFGMEHQQSGKLYGGKEEEQERKEKLVE